MFWFNSVKLVRKSSGCFKTPNLIREELTWSSRANLASIVNSSLQVILGWNDLPNKTDPRLETSLDGKIFLNIKQVKIFGKSPERSLFNRGIVTVKNPLMSYSKNVRVKICELASLRAFVPRLSERHPPAHISKKMMSLIL